MCEATPTPWQQHVCSMLLQDFILSIALVVLFVSGCAAAAVVSSKVSKHDSHSSEASRALISAAVSGPIVENMNQACVCVMFSYKLEDGLSFMLKLHH